MGKANGDVELRLVRRAELYAEPLREGRRAHPQINSDVQDPTQGTSHQLPHRRAHVLVVHAAQHAAARTRVPFLHKVQHQARVCEITPVPRFDKKASLVLKVIDIDGFSVSIEGDYKETLIYTKTNSSMILDYLTEAIDADEISIHKNKDVYLLEVKAQEFIDNAMLSKMKEQFNILAVRKLSPVLPVMSQGGLEVPFTTCKQMLEHKESLGKFLWQLALMYECARGNLTEQEVLERMNEIMRIMRNSVEHGLEGTHYDDRILGCQSGRFSQKMKVKNLLDVSLLNRIILYITAIMEVKSAMGIIVAAPTAGSCAVLPGACLAVSDELGFSDEDVVKAMLAGGMIGAFIASSSTFSAEVGGCQAECGAASGMAAAALATLGGSTTEQAVAAASIALQNSLGMICDPVANRVEVPCLGKNVMAASNALACANMALADYDPVIPLDEVIAAMDRVGRSLPYQLRCTALGGLSVTPTSRAIETRLIEK